MMMPMSNAAYMCLPSRLCVFAMTSFHGLTNKKRSDFGIIIVKSTVWVILHVVPMNKNVKSNYGYNRLILEYYGPFFGSDVFKGLRPNHKGLKYFKRHTETHFWYLKKCHCY